jgi:hypothetical protein
MKLEFSWDFFENYSNIKFLEIRPVGNELFYADGHDEANSLSSQFCESA